MKADEVRNIACCMCKADVNFKTGICVNCDFKVAWQDERGWVYHVRSGLGESQYKGFFTKESKDFNRGMKSHAMIAMTWREYFSQAQEDLNRHAKKKGWKVYESNQDNN